MAEAEPAARSVGVAAGHLLQQKPLQLWRWKHSASLKCFTALIALDQMTCISSLVLLHSELFALERDESFPPRSQD